MIKKINHNSRYTHRHMHNVERIKNVCHQNGYEADLEDCANIWEDYSDMNAAGWINLPEDDEDLWFIIKNEVKKQSIN